MKTDPNACAPIHGERKAWALLHDAVAHPLMALTLYSGWGSTVSFRGYACRDEHTVA